jgi:hypothetical protein
VNSTDLFAWYLLGFIAVHFAFRVLLSSAGVESLAGRLRRARLHPWRGAALLTIIGASLVLQLARVPVWIGEATVFPALAGVWLVSEVIAARWLRDEDAPSAVRVVHGVRLVVHLIAIGGLGAANHLVSKNESPLAIMLGVAGAVVLGGIVCGVAIWRGMQAPVQRAVASVIGNMERSSTDARARADRVEKLVGAGKLDEALQHATPLFDQACEDDAGWGVAGAACSAAQALIIGHAERGELARSGTALDVLEQISGRNIGPLAGLTTMPGMGRVIDALLAAESRDEAARALRVMAALRRHAPGMDFLFTDPVADVLTAQLDAGELEAALTLYRELVVGASPPIALEPELIARLEAAAVSSPTMPTKLSVEPT